MANYTRFQLRGDTKANWLSVNPILAKNEPAIETDTNRFKIGDGVSTYSQLSYGRNTSEYASLYNVTSLYPLPSGFYEHATAILAIPTSERLKGLIITYETASGVWYTERFIGTNVSGWTTAANWEKLPDAGDLAQLRSDLSEIESDLNQKVDNSNYQLIGNNMCKDYSGEIVNGYYDGNTGEPTYGIYYKRVQINLAELGNPTELRVKANDGIIDSYVCYSGIPSIGTFISGHKPVEVKDGYYTMPTSGAIYVGITLAVSATEIVIEYDSPTKSIVNRLERIDNELLVSSHDGIMDISTILVDGGIDDSNGSVWSGSANKRAFIGIETINNPTSIKVNYELLRVANYALYSGTPSVGTFVRGGHNNYSFDGKYFYIALTSNIKYIGFTFENSKSTYLNASIIGQYITPFTTLTKNIDITKNLEYGWYEPSDGSHGAGVSKRVLLKSKSLDYPIALHFPLIIGQIGSCTFYKGEPSIANFIGGISSIASSDNGFTVNCIPFNSEYIAITFGLSANLSSVIMSYDTLRQDSLSQSDNYDELINFLTNPINSAILNNSTNIDTTNERDAIINGATHLQDSGEKVIYPSTTQVYDYFWTRDYAMALDSNYAFNSDDVKSAYLLIKSGVPTTGVQSYWIPDHISKEGGFIYKAGAGFGQRASIDGIGFLVKIANKYVEKTKDIAFINSEIDFLSNALNSIMTPDYMVFVNEGEESVCFGFEDSIKFNGYIAYCTAQLYESFLMLKNWARIANIDRTFPIEEIKKAFNETFVVKISYVSFSSGLYSSFPMCYIKPSTNLNSGRFDTWVTAYAVRIGILTYENKIACANSLREFLDSYYKNGMFKHCPNNFYYSENQMWESYFEAVPNGTYQSGGYWATPAYDILFAIKLVDWQKAEEIKQEIIQNAHLADYPEYISDDLSIHTIGYVASVSYVSLIADRL